MFASGLITFRETLEAVLVVGIILTFLAKTNQTFYNKYVMRGIIAGILGAAAVAILLEVIFGGLTGTTEKLFEGILMLITAGFLTWMIIWVHRQKEISKTLKNKVTKNIEKGYGMGIFILVMLSILREGTETVLYLKASSLTGQSNQLGGAILGVIIALVLGFGIFKWAVKVNLDLIFKVTSVFLVLFAAGMIAHGVHEFQEIGLLPVFHFDPIINISHILDNSSTLGSLLRVMFGYTSKPTFMEIFSYSLYVGFIVWLIKYTDRLILSKAKNQKSKLEVK